MGMIPPGFFSWLFHGEVCYIPRCVYHGLVVIGKMQCIVCTGTSQAI